MNRTYRLVFNKALVLVQVVSELANCRGKKSAGKTSTSQAHIGFSEKSSAPFKLKAIAIASALTVGSLLIIASPSSFAAPIDNTSLTTPTITNGVSITGVNGVAGGDGNDYGEQGGDGGAAVFNGNGTITTLTNNSSITGGAGGAGGNGLERYSNGRYGGAAGVGIDNSYGTITTLNNNGSITGGVGAGSDNDGFGISNFGSIVTLDNAQGGNGLTPATTALT